MASFAELLTGIASDVQKSTPDIGEAITRGAQLAQQMQNMQVQRQQLEAQKQEIESTKFEKVGGWFETYSKMPEGSAKKAFGKKFIPTGINALGLSDKIDPNVLEMMTGDPNLSAYLVSKIRTGEMNIADLTQPEKIASVWAKDGKQFGDLQAFGQGVSEALPELQDAEKFALSEAGKSERAQAMAAEAARRAEESRAQAGDVELAKATNKEFKAYQAEGGSSGLNSNLKLLEETLAALESGKIKTGKIRSYIPTDTLKKLAGAGDLMALSNKAKKAIQSSLKATLGSQFTKEEGERVENRTFDIQLDTQYNIDALKAEIDKIKNTRVNAEDLFSKYVKGFKPVSVGGELGAGLQQIGPVEINRFNNLPESSKSAFLEKFAKQRGIDINTAKQMFGVK